VKGNDRKGKRADAKTGTKSMEKGRAKDRKRGKQRIGKVERE